MVPNDQYDSYDADYGDYDEGYDDYQDGYDDYDDGYDERPRRREPRASRGRRDRHYEDDDKLAQKAQSGMVIGIIAMVAWLLPILGLPAAISGIVVSIQGLKAYPNTKAVVGLILCIIGLVLTIINAVAGVLMAMNGVGPFGR